MAKRLAAGLVAIAALGVVAAFYHVSALTSRGGTVAPLYSTERYDPYGAAALRDLLLERGGTVHVLKRSRMDDNHSGVLLQVLPLPRSIKGACAVEGGSDTHSLPQLRRADLVEWIAKGNTVVQFTRSRTDLMDALNIRVRYEIPETGTSCLIENAQRTGEWPDRLPGKIVEAGWTQDAVEAVFGGHAPAGPLLLRSPVSFAEPKRGEWHPLATHGESVVAIEARYGRGRAVFVGAPTPALNRTLGEGGNLDFILALTGGEPVIFDAWSHGLGHSGSIIGLLRSYGLLPALFQIVFAMSLYVWTQRGRSCPETRHSARARSSAEQMKSLARLYDLSLKDRDIYDRAKNEVIRRLARVLRCPPEKLENEARNLNGDGAARARKTLDALATPALAGQGSTLIRRAAHALTLSHELMEEKPG